MNMCTIVPGCGHGFLHLILIFSLKRFHRFAYNCFRLPRAFSPRLHSHLLPSFPWNLRELSIWRSFDKLFGPRLRNGNQINFLLMLRTILSPEGSVWVWILV